MTDVEARSLEARVEQLEREQQSALEGMTALVQEVAQELRQLGHRVAQVERMYAGLAAQAVRRQ